jgi:hypothetical protein
VKKLGLALIDLDPYGEIEALDGRGDPAVSGSKLTVIKASARRSPQAPDSMALHRKRREASDPATRAEGVRPTEEAKPGAPRKRPNKGGKKTKQRTLSGRPGIAKKSARSRTGTDRSRHKRIDKRKHRGTSLSPSIR